MTNGGFPYKCKHPFYETAASTAFSGILLYLLFLKNSQHKIILKPKRHIWGWYILCSFNIQDAQRLAESAQWELAGHKGYRNREDRALKGNGGWPGPDPWESQPRLQKRYGPGMALTREAK